MNRGELSELHYITPISNICSILEHGLLSYNKASRLRHRSVAMLEIQDRREKVRVPGGLPLHDYVNLYFHARNPMMYKRKDQHEALCIIRINPDILDLPNVVISDQNASSDYRRFGAAPKALSLINKERVFAESWYYPDDYIETLRHRSVKCAEVLVPHQVDSSYIMGAYVSCRNSGAVVNKMAPKLRLNLNPYLFFR